MTWKTPEGPFQRAVKATTDRASWSKKTTLPGLFASLMIALGVSRQSDPVLLYMSFFGLVVIIALIWVMLDRRDPSIFSHESLRLSHWLPPDPSHAAPTL